MKKRGIKRQVIGVVTSDKMDKSVVVQAERLVKHKLYKKYIRRQTSFVESADLLSQDKLVEPEARYAVREGKRFVIEVKLAKP